MFGLQRGMCFFSLLVCAVVAVCGRVGGGGCWGAVCGALVCLLNSIFVGFGTMLYRQTVGVPVGTNCAPLVADLFLFLIWEISWGLSYMGVGLTSLRLSVQLQDALVICWTPRFPPPPPPPSPTVVYSTDRSKAVVPVLVLLFVTLWFILRGDLFYVLPCVILFLCFSVFKHCVYLAWGRES